MARSFDSLTRYIPLLNEVNSIGEWVFDKENDGSKEHPIFMPYFRYKDFFLQFITDVALFAAEYFYNFFITFHYNEGTILEANHIEWWPQKGFRDADIASVDAECILVLLVSAIQLERVNEGLLSSFFRDGSIVRWLSRLKEIDDQMEAAEEVEDYDEFDDEESGSTPSENPAFISFQNVLKRAFEKYTQMHPSVDINRFFHVITDELDRFSKGEEISCGYDFDFCLRNGRNVHYVSFHFEPNLIEVSDGGSVYDSDVGSDSYTNWMYSIWRSGDDDLPAYGYMPDFDTIVDLVSGGAKLSISLPDEFYYDSDDEPEIEEDSE